MVERQGPAAPDGRNGQHVADTGQAPQPPGAHQDNGAKPRVVSPDQAPTRADITAPIPVSAPAPTKHDLLGEVRWFDTPSVPATSPGTVSDVAPTPPTTSVAAESQPELTPQNVGRSAWDRELSSVDSGDPDGWEKLSWHDLDAGQGAHSSADFGGADEASSAPGLIREWGPVLIAAVVIAFLTRMFLVQAYHIPSLSMAPTLQEGDRVIVNRLSYDFGDIQRGQVIVFSTPPNQPSDADDLIKRVIGLPGETVSFRDGRVYVDGLLLEEPYVAQKNTTRARSFDIPGCEGEERSSEQCAIPSGYVFVMGDNRTGSQDSRVFGPVPTDAIVGRAVVRVWPLDNLGGL